jgi:hypothetical protein
MGKAAARGAGRRRDLGRRKRRSRVDRLSIPARSTATSVACPSSLDSVELRRSVWMAGLPRAGSSGRSAGGGVWWGRSSPPRPFLVSWPSTPPSSPDNSRPTICAAPVPNSAGSPEAPSSRSSSCWDTPPFRRPNATSGEAGAPGGGQRQAGGGPCRQRRGLRTGQHVGLPSGAQEAGYGSLSG